MELVDGDTGSPTLISNVEVMELLKKNMEERAKAAPKKKNNKRNKHFRHRDWVEEEVHRYLTTTPCVKLDPNRRQEFHDKLKSRKKVALSSSAGEAGENDDDGENGELKSSLTGFGLTEAEALQIMNTMPTEPVEIHLMVDELQSRMTETRQEEFLAFIASYCKPEGGDDGSKAQPADQVVSNVAIEKWLGGDQSQNGKKPAAKVKQEEDTDSHKTGAI
ncbi:III subunit RPC9 [Seminavis robusta]|uniref:DNA-directed RNA polymerase III subunit RPC9 n=1 Tax=Seminavis robusta TaxID=568900 RepID=A0A9N8ERU8_9STRA|nr:III subunit RPC9 [Seminavis robusta]|eukprot:Sro1507_g278400.1 III subunit RPC9 (219) ;mRNA; f:21738-22394